MIELVTPVILLSILMIAWMLGGDNPVNFKRGDILKIMLISFAVALIPYSFITASNVSYAEYGINGSNITNSFVKMASASTWVAILFWVYIFIMTVWAILEWVANTKNEAPTFKDKMEGGFFKK